MQGQIRLNPTLITDKLCHSNVELLVLETTRSTNDYVKQFIDESHRTIACLVESQTDGKGRLNRGWYSPHAENILLSLLCPLDDLNQDCGSLSLVIGLGVCDAIESTLQLNKHSFKVKWPNDIVFNNQKLAGILCELQTDAQGNHHLIIGLGLNVNMLESPADVIQKPWTSLSLITGKPWDRNLLSAAIIDRLIDVVERFKQTGLAGFMAAWEQRDNLIDKPISLISGQDIYHGTCLGINDSGALLIKQDGQILSFASGDASIFVGRAPGPTRS